MHVILSRLLGMMRLQFWIAPKPLGDKLMHTYERYHLPPQSP